MSPSKGHAKERIASFWKAATLENDDWTWSRGRDGVKGVWRKNNPVRIAGPPRFSFLAFAGLSLWRKYLPTYASMVPNSRTIGIYEGNGNPCPGMRGKMAIVFQTGAAPLPYARS